MLVVLFLCLSLAATSVYMSRGSAPAPPSLAEPEAPRPTTAAAESRGPVAGTEAVVDRVSRQPEGRPTTRALPSTLDFTVALLPLGESETDASADYINRRVYEELLVELRDVPGLDLLVLETADAPRDPEIADFVIEVQGVSGTSREELAQFRIAWTATRGGQGAWLASQNTSLATLSGAARGAVAAFRRYPFPPEDGELLALEAIALNSGFPEDQRITALDDIRKIADRYGFIGRDEKRAVAQAAVEIVTQTTDTQIRGRTWRAMMGLEDPYLVAPLTDTVLRDPSDSVRIEAVKLLSADYSADPQAQSALQYALVNDLSPRVRLHARWETLDDADREAFIAATLLDTELSDAERFELVMADVREIRRYMDRRSAMALVDISSRARPTAAGPFDRETTGDVSAADVVPVLIEMLEDQSNEQMLRSSMVSSLERHIDEPGVRERLDRAMRNESSELVRSQIRRVLGPWAWMRR